MPGIVILTEAIRSPGSGTQTKLVMEGSIMLKIEGDKVIITLPYKGKAAPYSSTGKSKLLATTNGYQATGIQVDGQEVKAMVMVIIPAR